MGQDVKLDRMTAKMEANHVILFELASDIASVKVGGTSELSRVNLEIATKTGKKDVERKLRASRVKGAHTGVAEGAGAGIVADCYQKASGRPRRSSFNKGTCCKTRMLSAPRNMLWGPVQRCSDCESPIWDWGPMLFRGRPFVGSCRAYCNTVGRFLQRGRGPPASVLNKHIQAINSRGILPNAL